MFLHRVTLEQKQIVRWKCVSNTSINNKIAGTMFIKPIVFETPVIPSIGETIIVSGDSKRYTIKNITREINIQKGIENFTVFAEPEEMYIDYYDYMKTFTHSCDEMKADSDPTKDLLRLHDPVILPKTWEKWLEAKKILET